MDNRGQIGYLMREGIIYKYDVSPKSRDFNTFQVISGQCLLVTEGMITTL